MYSRIAAAGALVAAVAAVPMAQEKRDIVMVTNTEIDVVTVPVTTTVWVDAGSDATSVAHYGHHTHSTSHVTSYVTLPAASSPASSAVASSPSSVYVAPSPSSTYVAPSSSSVYVAPTTSTYVAPTSTYVAPTSTYVAPSSTSEAAAASSSTSSDSSSGSGLSYGMAKSGTKYTGDMTYYTTGLGACGWTNGYSDKIAAVSYDIFDSYAAEESVGGSNSNPVCGKTVTITGVDGMPYVATIVDRCPGCDAGSLDLSQGFFDSVTSNGDGRVHNINWVWN